MTFVSKYRKKPVEIEAVQLTIHNGDDVAGWCGGQFVSDVSPRDYKDVHHYLKIPTLEGVMTGQIGDYIIRGVKGEYYPCKPDIFDDTYEVVE